MRWITRKSQIHRGWCPRVDHSNFQKLNNSLAALRRFGRVFTPLFSNWTISNWNPPRKNSWEIPPKNSNKKFNESYAMHRGLPSLETTLWPQPNHHDSTSGFVCAMHRIIDYLRSSHSVNSLASKSHRFSSRTVYFCPFVSSKCSILGECRQRVSVVGKTRRKRHKKTKAKANEPTTKKKKKSFLYEIDADDGMDDILKCRKSHHTKINNQSEVAYQFQSHTVTTECLFSTRNSNTNLIDQKGYCENPRWIQIHRRFGDNKIDEFIPGISVAWKTNTKSTRIEWHSNNWTQRTCLAQNIQFVFGWWRILLWFWFHPENMV